MYVLYFLTCIKFTLLSPKCSCRNGNVPCPFKYWFVKIPEQYLDLSACLCAVSHALSFHMIVVWLLGGVSCMPRMIAGGISDWVWGFAWLVCNCDPFYDIFPFCIFLWIHFVTWLVRPKVGEPSEEKSQIPCICQDKSVCLPYWRWQFCLSLGEKILTSSLVITLLMK